MTEHPSKVLLAYASVGSGHEQAARALGEAFTKRGWSTAYIDFLDEVPAPMRFVMRDAYLQLIKVLPLAYDLAFKRTVSADVREAERTSLILSTMGYQKLRDVAVHESPDAIISTNLFPTLALARAKRHIHRETLMVNCFTDYILQTLYFSKGVDWHVSANEEVTSEFLVAHRRVRQPIRPFGIPVRSAFTCHRTRAEARGILNVPRQAHLAVIMGGGLGLGHILEACDAITSKDFGDPLTVAALCGSNTTLRGQVQDLAVARSSRHTIIPVGWTDQAPVWMQAADVLVSKAGGVTLAEAAAVGVPLVTYQPLPGQESVNVQFLMRHEATCSAETTDQLLSAVEELMFTARGPRIAENLRNLGKPTAADDVADCVCRESGYPGTKGAAS